MLMPNAIFFLKNLLGPDFVEKLNKTELYKLPTNTTVDPHEIQIALQIVPKAVLHFLINELGPMEVGESKKFIVPIKPKNDPEYNQAEIEVNKQGMDVYNGCLIKNGKIIARFENRALPSVGLHIMSAFELYDTNLLAQPSNDTSLGVNFAQLNDAIDRAIEQKMRLNYLINKIVDEKLNLREAGRELLHMKLKDFLKQKNKRMEASQSSDQDSSIKTKVITISNKKTGPENQKQNSLDKIKNFLNKIHKNKTIEVKITKHEKIECPDCKQVIFTHDKFSGCICLGLDRDKKIYLTKKDNSILISFSKNWDVENVDMVLDIIKKFKFKQNKLK